MALHHHTHCLGLPRIGRDRELKWLLERYWRDDCSQDELMDGAARLRRTHWQNQQDAGLSVLTCGDFSLYDQMLDTAIALGAIPERFGGLSARDQGNPLELLFAMARGREGAPACEMTKWFNTNYHYLVPELQPAQTFSAGYHPTAAQLAEMPRGVKKAVLIGPATFLYLSKMTEGGKEDKLALLDSLLAAYRTLVKRLGKAGADWIQLDEPILSLDLEPKWRQAIERGVAALKGGPKLLLTSYFGPLRDNLDFALQLPVQGLHLDATGEGGDGCDELVHAAQALPRKMILSAGVVNGRNIWRCNLAQMQSRLAELSSALGERLWIGSGCSLLHCPMDIEAEQKLDADLMEWLSFALQKLREIALIAKSLEQPDNSEVQASIIASTRAHQLRDTSGKVHLPEVQRQVAEVNAAQLRRHSAYPNRAAVQKEHLKLPQFPTTTIGSFPQTPQIRKARLQYRQGRMDEKQYRKSMEDEISLVISEQEQMELDVLVHGEPERNDMVEYFGELLTGMATTGNGWVQSYGSRCVKPPIIYGDICRPEPMTVQWSQYAQSLTDRPVKAMLTGPVTILCWSFERDDLPKSTCAMQIALTLRDEVQDLEQAGLGIIQIDEPAFRESMPLRRADHGDYFQWAVDSFLLSSCGADDRTQIHSHMCYAEFNDIVAEIARLDADVISIETSRSNMELLDVFGDFNYPNEIGPGVYDIHSPVVPQAQWMEQLMRKAAGLIDPDRLWINPDCGLKTRGWKEIRPALRNMVDTARRMRKAD